MKKIKVVYYGYKSKMLYDVVKENSLRASKNYEIVTIVFDQTNIERNSKFNEICNRYEHIKWDTLESKFGYRQSEINKDDYDYMLVINDAILLDYGWDETLVSLCSSDDVVVSGCNNLVFDNSIVKFYPLYQKLDNDCERETAWIQNTFIFANRTIMQKMPDISFLKDFGEEEILSLHCFLKNIRVIAMPTEFADLRQSTYNTQDYYPFSRRHNYKEVIDVFRGKSQRYPEITSADIQNFSKLHNYPFHDLNYFPYNTNDIGYRVRMEIDDIGEERFFLKINKLK